MNEMSENKRGLAEEKRLQEMLAKVRVIARGPHGESFFKVGESFCEQTESEYFCPEDLKEIAEGKEDLRQGRYLTLEDYRQGKRL